MTGKMTKWILDKYLQWSMFWYNLLSVEGQETKAIDTVVRMPSKIIISELSIKALCFRLVG